MIQCDYCIVGGGIIGLSIAKYLIQKKPNAKIILIEKEHDVALHASGRNSGVLHAGFYYTSDSLKAKFTKDGNSLLQDYCIKNNLKLNRCAKIIVASNMDEIQGLDELKKRGDANNVELHYIDQEQLKIRYPNIKTIKKALFSPSTATIDPKQICNHIYDNLKKQNIKILLNTKYIKKLDNSTIKTSHQNIKFKKLINCAGLYADKIAKDFGFARNFTIIPFKGIYLKDTLNKNKLDTNIYPVPNLKNPFLGVHFTLTVDNEAKIGPTAIPALWRENYQGFKNFSLLEFISILAYETKLFITNSFNFRSLAYEEVKKYYKPFLLNLAKKLQNNSSYEGFNSWSTPGIRAQLLNTKTLELIQDFVVESDDKTIHVLNAVSPAFTSSFPFAQWVIDNHILKDDD
jgi:L-2-hydroxyglutarate oxidase LhgO